MIIYYETENGKAICFNHAVQMIILSDGGIKIKPIITDLDESLRPKCLACEAENKPQIITPSFLEDYIV
jgi:hypothetical protein